MADTVQYIKNVTLFPHKKKKKKKKRVRTKNTQLKLGKKQRSINGIRSAEEKIGNKS